jgi:hypothetical protein
MLIIRKFIDRISSNIHSSIISYPLTAAHCMYDKGQPEPLEADDVTAMVGKHYLNILNETGALNSSVHEIILNPEWKSTKDSFHADIAILVFTDAVKFTELIRPICLPEQTFNDIVTGSGVIVGWGQSQRNHRHDIKPNGLVIPVVNSTHCFTQFPDLAKIASDSSFCGGYENQGKAPCLGDSGGGLYFQRSRFTPWLLRGIVSSSLLDQNRQCNINAFQLYTNVAQFADWIDKTVDLTMKTEWENVEFQCNFNDEWGGHECTHHHVGRSHKYMKFETDFDDTDEVKRLSIELAPFDRIISGIGEIFTNLKSFIAENQNIKMLKSENFAGMTQLTALSLRENPLKPLKENVFEHLISLEGLDLYNCQLEEFPVKIFSNQPNLKKLSLANNNLRYLNKDLFAHNPKLELIILQRNTLKQIDLDFTSFPNLERISLLDNVCINSGFNVFDPKNLSVSSIQELQQKINQNCTGSAADTNEIWVKFSCREMNE